MGGRFGEGVREWGSGKIVQRTLCVKKSICESSLRSQEYFLYGWNDWLIRAVLKALINLWKMFEKFSSNR